MRDKNVKKVIIGIIIVFIISLIAIPLSALIVKNMVRGNINNPLFIFDFSKSISIYDMLILYFTIVGIGVTGLLTWAIFAFSHKKEADENDKRRMWIYSDILFLLNQIFKYENNNLSAFIVGDDWKERVSHCHEFLSDVQYFKLMEFYGKCHRLLLYVYGEEAQKASVFSEEILEEVLLPFYRIYKHEINRYEIKDVSVLLNTEYIDILNAIYPIKKDYLPPNDKGHYSDGKDLYRFLKQNGNYKVWNHAGEMLCEASFKEGEIWNGEARVSRYGRLYIGSYHEGKRNGQGIEYDNNGTTKTIIASGKWKDNILLNGEIFSVPANSGGKKSSEVSYVRINANDKTSKVFIENVADFDVNDGILNNPKNEREGKKNGY